MIKRTLKLAWFKRNRYALTIVAIALSVAFIVSTLLLTTSISDVGAPLQEAYTNVDAVVTGPEVTEADGPQQALAAQVPVQVLNQLTAAGFDAEGFANPYAQVINSDGAAGGQDQAASNVARPWLGESPLNGFEIVEGRPPVGEGQAAIDVTTASSAGLAVGDAMSFVSDTGLQEVELVGLASFGGADNEPYMSIILLDSQHPVLAPGQGYDYVLVAGATEADVAPLTPGLETRSGADWITSQVDQLNNFLGFFSTFLTVFAVIAVVVGMVIVTNTFTVSLAQRTEELALLRLVGTTRRQLLEQVVIEAFLLGAAGTLIGIVFGLLGVNALGGFLDLLGLTIERSNAISVNAILIGMLVGIGVTVFAAVRPAWKASEVAPIEALRSVDVEAPGASTRRTIAAAAAMVIAAGCLIWGVSQADITFTGVGIGAAFLGLYLLADVLIRGTAIAVRPLLSRAGPTGTVASRNLQRNASRTSAASSALMIGICLISFFTLMAATIGQLIAGDSGQAFKADLVVQGIGNQPEPALNDETLEALAAVDGVDRVVPLYQTSAVPADGVEIERAGPGGGALGVAFTDVEGLELAYDFVVNAGSLDDVTGNSVVVDQLTADAAGLAVGDGFPLTSQAGQVDVVVGAIIETSLPGTPQPAIIGDVELAESFGYTLPATAAYLVGDAEQGDVSTAIDLPTIEVVTADDYIDGLSSNLDTILALVYALLAVAVIVALVGIANTVSLAISERVGEIAATRAAGASSRQILWSLLAEFGLLALVGIVSGLALAWVSAATFFTTLSDGQIGTPETDLVTGGLIITGGLAAAVAASWFPARSASRTDILDVLRAD